MEHGARRTEAEADERLLVLEDVWRRWKELLVETETFVFVDLSPEERDLEARSEFVRQGTSDH